MYIIDLARKVEEKRVHKVLGMFCCIEILTIYKAILYALVLQYPHSQFTCRMAPQYTRHHSHLQRMYKDVHHM